MGGSAYIYLKKQKDIEKVKQTLLSLEGVEEVITKEEAVKRYHLLPDRVGDLMVLGNKTTVFGVLQDVEREALPANYRSHGSTYECIVPLFVYNAKNAPQADYFDHNYKLAAWLYR